MEKKDLNDISADEIIRRLNKTLGIEPENDAEDENASDNETRNADNGASENTASAPDIIYPIADTGEDDTEVSEGDDDFDILYLSSDEEDYEDDTTLKDIFDSKKKESSEAADSLVGFSDTLDRLDDSVYQPAPMKRSQKNTSDENTRSVNSINISTEKEEKAGRIFFNDAEYDDVEFPDTPDILLPTDDPDNTEEDNLKQQTTVITAVKDDESGDTIALTADMSKSNDTPVDDEISDDTVAVDDKTVISPTIGSFSGEDNEEDDDVIVNDTESDKPADENLDFGFDQVYRNTSETSSDGYDDAEHRIMDAMVDFSKALEDVYDNDKENTDIATIGRAGEKKKDNTPRKAKKNSGEYTNTAQRKPFKDRYKKLYKSSRVKLICACLFTLLLLTLETVISLGYTVPHFLDPISNPRVLVLVAFQLFLIVFAFFFTGFLGSIKALANGKITGELLTTSFSIITIAFGIYQAIVSTQNPILIFSPCAFCITATLLNERRDLKREISSFNIASSNMIKYTIDEFKPSSESVENDEFYSYLPENPTMFKINKTNFVENFVSNTRKHSRSKTHFLISGAVCFLAALIAFFAMFLLKKGFDTSFTYAFVLFSAIIPSSLFTAFSYPLYKAATIASQDNSTFIGECAADDFSEAAVVSFDDKEVFPSYALKLLSVKVYGENRIDHVLFAATSVFKKLGGPLYDVFENASREIEKTDNVKIFSVYDDGIEATVNEEHILLGSASFMEKQNFIPVYTDDDQSAEAKNAKRIMYMASGGTIVAKLYLKYSADSDFSAVLQQLTDAGMCIAIKTFDPNIDTSLLASEINIKKYPVRVVKCSDRSELSQTLQSTDATIVSKGSAKSLLKVLTNCRKLSSVIKTGVLISFVSIIIGIMVAAFTIFAGIESGISSLVVVLYQLLWMITCNIFTNICIK